MRLSRLALLFAGVALATGAAPPPPHAPHVAVASFDALPQPLPLPYHGDQNADRAVASARAKAKATGKRLLIDFGGNWCLDCRLLAGTMDLAALKPFVDRHFVVVTVDVGHFDKNLQIARRYGIAKLEGVPNVLIVDPRTNRVVNRGRTAALADARSMTPQALADWLAQWA